MEHSPLAQIIQAIGSPEFAATAASALRDFMKFDSTVVIRHRRQEVSVVIYHDFDATGCHRGIENYVRCTHRVNPMVVRAPEVGTCRARDFASHPLPVDDGVVDHLIYAEDEELGFRTVGWPERQEEIGMYFEATGELMEISLYRDRGRSFAPSGKLRALERMREPVAAAFNRHNELSRTKGATLHAVSALSPREREIHALLLQGCSSKRIALLLNISCYTVKDHRKSIFRKLGVGSLAGLFALQS